MTAPAFSWRALQAELAASPYLLPDDDLSTQRGIVATAVAITQRMSDDYRHLSWQPARLWARPAPEKPVDAPSAPEAPEGPGGCKVAPAALPRVPRPGGAAVMVPEIVF